MSTDSPSNNFRSSHPEQGEQGDSDKLLELCPSCSRHDSWSSCVCSRLEQAYELGRQSKLSSPPPEGQDELFKDIFNTLISSGDYLSYDIRSSIESLKSKYIVIKK